MVTGLPLCGCLSAAGYGSQPVSGLVLLGVLVTVVLAVVGTLVFAHWRLDRSLRELSSLAAAVGAGDFTQRTQLARNDAIGGLGLAMNQMCDRLQGAQIADEAHIGALEQLRHSDRLATLGRLASSVAHELGNPLNVIDMRAQLIECGGAATLSEARQNAELIRAQTQRMTRIIQDILSFARRQPAQITRCDLARVTRAAVALCENSAKRRNILLRCDVPGEAVEIDADEHKLVQVVVNLVLNGIQATPQPGGTVSVSLQEQLATPHDDSGAPAQRYARIQVTDRGEGIARASLARIFEPFFSTKSASEGTGLGLSVAEGIVKEHAGWITVESELGRGASFEVYLPRANCRLA
ncbi:MAG TPA: HAMP domain-containing sensor histidine kinase [Polyangiales bacterium]|nr:HAMP domain-containing sensor histidine kinase [Polyangiales bacterium]